MDFNFSSGKKSTIHKAPKIILPLALTIIFLTVFPLYYTRSPDVDANLYPPNHQNNEEIPTDLTKNHPKPEPIKTESRPESKPRKTGSRPEPEPIKTESQPEPEPGNVRKAESFKRCDIFTGEWVPNPAAPYYTNDTCWGIQEHQNCMKFGRPDNGYLKWRWKPDDCELPIFDPFDFLELVRGKALAFVGDSIARNHMQSLVCLLSRAANPLDVSETKNDDNRKSFVYEDFDFNITMFWSPYLVKTGETFSEINKNPFNLYLDEFDESWTTKIKNFDYVIINAGHWFFRPTTFYLQGKLVGCLYCSDPNITQLPSSFSYRWALKTAFRAINSLENFKGVTFLRTFAPQHFEHGPWDQGGECARTKPFMRNDSSALSEFKFESYDIQREEFRIAKEEGRKKGTRLRLFDVTQAMLLRPDGHPNKYGHRLNRNVTYYNDCVHWCLPGPIDTWGDFFLELLRREVQDRSLR